MKRKRGHKKGKGKKLLLVEASASASASAAEAVTSEVTSGNSEDDSGSSEENDGKAETEEDSESPKAELPPEPPAKVTNIRPDGLIERPPPTAVYGRVKVKLKAKPWLSVEPHVPPSDGTAKSDNNNNEKNSQQVSVDKQQRPEVVVVTDNAEEGVNLLSESKKSGGIKIMSSKGLSPPGVKESQGQEVMVVAEKAEDNANSFPESKKSGGIKIVSSKGLSPPGVKESGGNGSLPEERREEKREEQEVKASQQALRYSKNELEASLEVIKKAMKMDAAEPFNVPVNPIELGIPDYFDVIDTPMDFGTIRKNLENGAKYMNSEDVYKDVQYIWENCFKYNNKGDYIVDLMKRVKKNFMKYWMVAGLYHEQTKLTAGDESIFVDEAATPGYGKKLKRGKGVKRHKDDCMCAICIMKRRRREREAREAQDARKTGIQAASPQTEVNMTVLPQEYKQEENPHPESPHGEDTSSYMETSPDVDVDVEMEDGEEMRLEGAALQYDEEQKAEDYRVQSRDKSDRSGDVSEKSRGSDRGENESSSHIEAKIQDESGRGIKLDALKQPPNQPEGQIAGHMQQRHKLLELEKKRQRLRLIETFRDLENPMLLGLCRTLFPNNRQSVWDGVNSLVGRPRACHRSDIHEAVALFMNPCKSTSSPQ